MKIVTTWLVHGQKCWTCKVGLNEMCYLKTRKKTQHESVNSCKTKFLWRKTLYLLKCPTLELPVHLYLEISLFIECASKWLNGELEFLQSVHKNLYRNYKNYLTECFCCISLFNKISFLMSLNNETGIVSLFNILFPLRCWKKSILESKTTSKQTL